MEQGDFRPMAHNRDAMNDLVAILDARAPFYGRAHATVDTSGKSLAACVEELVKVAEGLMGKVLALLWHILACARAGVRFPNQHFSDPWVVGFGGRP